MTILNRLYASSGSEVILDTLQVNIGDTNIYLVRDYEDLVATLETGESVTFQQSVMDVALPARNTDGTQDMKIAISNITGEASTTIRQALKDKSKITILYRRYTSDDLSAPSKLPISLKVKSGSWTNTEAQLTAGYMNILDTAWPRSRYTTRFAPGLRYT